MHTGVPKEGSYRLRSALRKQLGHQKQYLATQGHPALCSRLHVVAEAEATFWSVRPELAWAGDSSALVVQPSPDLFLSVPMHDTFVDLWHSHDGSGRQIWRAVKDEKLHGWKLVIAGGHCGDRHALSCGLDDGFEHVDLWYEHTWLFERVWP